MKVLQGIKDGRTPGRRIRVGIVTVALFTMAVSLGLSAASAGAASFQRPFKEVFGSAAQPTFEWPSLLAVDPNTGDLLVGDATAKSIKRFHADGTPAPFAALGSNAIDGKRGPGGHTRAECETAPEPESCDETPQNGLEFENSGQNQQIAVDSSGGPTNGNIYLTQKGLNLVDVFSSAGKYLGQLTATTEHSFSGPCGVAVDSNGAVYVGGGRASEVGEIAKFVPTGTTPVNADNTETFVVEGHERVCRMATGVGLSAGWLFAAAIGPAQTLKVNTDTGERFDFAKDFANSLTVDLTSGNPILGAGTGGQAPEGAEFSGSLEQATERISRLFPLQGSKQMRDLAANAAGDVYIVVGPSDPRVFVYGAPVVVPTVIAEPPTNVTGTRATLQGVVNPSGLAVTTCFFEWGTTTSYGNKQPCEGSIGNDTDDHPVHYRIPGGLTQNGATYHFRVVATNENGTEVSDDRAFTTAKTVVTDPATAITENAATLNATLRPEGQQFTECAFEWGLARNASYEHSAVCDPTAAEIEPGFVAQPVSAHLTKLAAGERYRFRVTTDLGNGEPEEFTTVGAPQIDEVRALNATRDSAQIEARVNPMGLRTTYRFEWGSTAAYGNVIPAGYEPSVGSGTGPALATASLSGLAPATIYHYRIVATNEAGTTVSPDQELETLNACSLPDGRCLELVSPRELPPVAAPGSFLVGIEMHFQAAEQPGSLAYAIEAGLQDSPKGGEVLYRGVRSESGGWETNLLSPPTIALSEVGSTSSSPSRYLGLSADLGCGVLASNQPLTADPVARLIIEAGGSNLYRRGPDGSFRLITDLPPEELKPIGLGLVGTEFNLVGMSRDCSTVVFSTAHHYAGLPGLGGERVFEWRNGRGLRYLGWVPKAEGEQVAEASVGKNGEVVSDDGSRVFFMAKRVVAGNPSTPSEVGKQGLFVREHGTVTRDVSASTTGVANTGATYAGATPDGSKAYFTANAGLTPISSGEGTDLYEYDLNTSTLKDLSVSQEPGGAAVSKVVGIAADGSHAYFTSRAQLVPGQGKTRVKNEAADTFSLYDANGGSLKFVATVSGRTSWANLESGLNGGGPTKTTRVSPEGRYFLFETLGNVTGYESGEVPQAYLYDANNSAEPVVCVSCRHDGAPPVFSSRPRRPIESGLKGNPLYEPQALVVKNGKAKVFFASRDRLASGAIEGVWNLYEWSHGQVFHIASEPAGFAGPAKASQLFAGASANGDDLYFFDPAALNWENPQARYAAWDARVGGGFAQPAPPPPPCDPAREGDGSCHGGEAGTPASPNAGTTGFSGEGNFKPKKSKKKHHKKHRKHHKQKQGKKKQGKKKQGKKKQGKKKQGKKNARQASRNGGAGK